MRSSRIAGFVALLLLCSLSVVFANLAFTIIGDWGVKLAYTNVIAARSTQRKSQFTVALGDNFYKVGTPNHGVQSTKDGKWKSIFEDQFSTSVPFFRKRFYVIAGNHDYDGDEKAQVKYTTTKKGNRWHFPSLYYKFTKRANKVKGNGAITVDFFMLDSQVIANSAQELSAYNRKVDKKQLAWLKNQLAKSRATWKFVFSHHAIYQHQGKNEFLVKEIVPAMVKAGVSLFVNGHLHNFQHLVVKSQKINYVTVGNTGIQVPLDPPKRKVKGLTIAKLHPTQALWDTGACGTDNCKGFAIVEVKSKCETLFEYYTSKNVREHHFTVKNPKCK
jgi:predicted phosphodiesterase